MSPDTWETLRTFILAVASIAAAFAAKPAVDKGIELSKKRKARQAEQGEVSDNIAAEYQNYPLAFVRDVMEFQKQTSRQRESDKEEYEKKLQDAKEEFEAQIENLKKDFDRRMREQQEKEDRIWDALTRWLAEVFQAWGRVDTIPMPTGADAVTLAPILQKLKNKE
jgi:flagellar motility protein MotE (MotC chaperone)